MRRLKVRINFFINEIWAASWQNQQNGMCAQRRLRSASAPAQSDQSSLCAQWVDKDPSFLHADSEDSDQTGWMPVWVFDGRTCHFVGFVMRRLFCLSSRFCFQRTRLLLYEIDVDTFCVFVLQLPVFSYVRLDLDTVSNLNFDHIDI